MNPFRRLWRRWRNLGRIEALQLQIDGLQAQVKHAAAVTQDWASHTRHAEVNKHMADLRTGRMIQQLVEHLKRRGDPESLAALREIDADAKTFNPLLPDRPRSTLRIQPTR